jgi:serine/threonine protein kinase
MTPERWQRIEEVLQAVLDCPAAERAALLAERCAGDQELESETRSLIEAHEAAGEFMEHPALEQDASVLIAGDGFEWAERDIGPYQITGLLGTGGMGEVYLAHDRRLNRPVALKILPSYFVSDPERLRRFQTEARAASALNHTNILTIYEVGEADGIHFIAAEYIEGPTIRELIDAGKLSLEEVLDVVIQSLFGLEAAHASGIVHRDIKPENIMRRRDGVIRILDFGIAKLLEPQTATTTQTSSQATSLTADGALLGTIGYVSPEQLRGLPVDHRTDVWASGVVLYEMLRGERPFAGVTNADTIVAILEREPASLFTGKVNSAALRRLQQIVDRALSKQASDRYPTAAEMAADLIAVRQHLQSAPDINGQVNVSELRALAGGDISTGRRNFVRVLVCVAVLIALVAGWYLYHLSNSRRKAEAAIASARKKTYVQMNEAERLQFINEQEQRVSALMGEGPTRLNDEALQEIKRQIDRYVFPKASDAEHFSEKYNRAKPYIPFIANTFAARRIPAVVAIYLPMVESAYQPCYENEIGAKGLFQFLPQTARNYGVAPEDMCDVNKMAPAAAHYIADRMAELGDDAQSMTLVLLSYNRGAESVRDELRLLREIDSRYERNFWTLFANRDKLDATFRQESAYYVPNFFAVAIIGENPETFGMNSPPLLTLATQSR